MAIQPIEKAGSTRERILQAAGDEMNRVGYRAMGLNDILHKLCMSKGALYHHFKSKLELGYAVLDELYAKRFLKNWESPLEGDDPLQTTIDYLRSMSEQKWASETLRCGCPVTNLATEMSPIDEGFRLRVEGVFSHWKKRMTRAFKLAQKRGKMRDDVSAEETAVFVIATVEGAVILAKNAQDVCVFSQAIKTAADYLESLQSKSPQ